MTEDEFRKRLDVHMERGNEIMARSDETMAECREEFRLNREFHAKILADWREYTRSLLLRVERIGREELKELAELRGESRAQTEALWVMIDRMNRLDPPPAGI